MTDETTLATCPTEREQFEAVFSASPYEFIMSRWPDHHRYSWPGQYREYHVQAAWEAWQAARAQPPAPQGLSDWDLRGMLAANLTCWHRLKGSEADELVALARRWPNAPALVPLAEAELERRSATGPVYSVDGVVTRGPIEYRRELEARYRRGWRDAEAAHGITGATHGEPT